MDFEDLLKFWFGKQEETRSYLESRAKIWFGGDPKFDEELRSRFQMWLLNFESVAATWLKTPRGTLAAVILHDQIPRNIYRGTSKAFQYDVRALGICKTAIADEWDLKLSLAERIFMYLPLEHSENLSDQELSLQAFQNLLSAVPRELDAPFDQNLEYAVRHWEIILKFGRFPHRNAILGRPSTDEEVDFLKNPGSAF